MDTKQMSENEKMYGIHSLIVNIYYSELKDQLAQSNENLINKIHDISMIFKNIF